MIGVGWVDRGMPEVKSIRYQVANPARVIEDDPTQFDCGTLASLSRPALLVWSFHDRLPSPGVAPCASLLEGAGLHHHNGRPAFRAVLLP